MIIANDGKSEIPSISKKMTKPLFTTHSPVETGSFETQSTPRKEGYAGEQNPETNEFSSHFSAFGAEERYFVRHRSVVPGMLGRCICLRIGSTLWIPSVTSVP
jgi:hypothetical protein